VGRYSFKAVARRPGHVALIGDSAGGALAVTTILRARHQGLPLPVATMPLSPWLDMEANGATFETNAQKGLIVSRDIIQAMGGMFLGEGGNRRDPLANPLCADLAGLPPMYIQTWRRRDVARRQPQAGGARAQIGRRRDARGRPGNAARLPIPGRHCSGS
jgi:acetyl esterase/lipase